MSDLKCCDWSSDVCSSDLDEHDRDVVFHGIDQLALFANKGVLHLFVNEIAFAFWARQYIEQFFSKCQLFTLDDFCQSF
jgi:hypothetical protein